MVTYDVLISSDISHLTTEIALFIAGLKDTCQNFIIFIVIVIVAYIDFNSFVAFIRSAENEVFLFCSLWSIYENYSVAYGALINFCRDPFDYYRYSYK